MLRIEAASFSNRDGLFLPLRFTIAKLRTHENASTDTTIVSGWSLEKLDNQPRDLSVNQ